MEELTQNQIKDYIKKYATKHHITEEEAKEHLMVKLIEAFYKGEKT